MGRRLTLLVWLAASVACTDADIYTASGAEPFRPDRLTLSGRLCTEDTGGVKFPVKILVMMDTTPAMFRADPDNYRLCGGGSTCAPGSLSRLVDRTSRQTNAFLGFASVASMSKSVSPVAPTSCSPPPCDPQQFYSPSGIDTGLLEGSFGLLDSSTRDIVNAISQAEAFIAADLGRVRARASAGDGATAGEILRTRYVVYMLLAGPPEGRPAPTPEALAAQVESLRDFVLAQGALEFRLHIGLLYFGERSIDRGTPPYNCHSPGDTSATCSCAAACHASNPNYCGVCCALEASADGYYDDLYEQARTAYAAMTFAGKGVLHEFECPNQIDLQVGATASSVRLMRKDIVAYNLNARLGAEAVLIDSDGDGLTDGEEIMASPPTDSTHWDTDGDMIGDRVEFRAFPRQDPTDPSDLPDACADPARIATVPDLDRDLLNDCEEGLMQTSASIPDTDGDGLPDALELMSGTVPTSAVDRLLDFDGDGVTNAQEVLEHTSPRTNEGRLRGAEGYRSRIVDVGRRLVPAITDQAELRAVTFRNVSPNVVGGAALLRYNAGARTLEFSDARWQLEPRFDPVPTVIEGDGASVLYAANVGTGEQIWAEVTVVTDWLPETDVVVYPQITISDRNCYDVRIGNIKLVETASAEDVLHPGSRHAAGTNHVLVFFTQAPEDRLDAPGISKFAEIDVRYACSAPDNPESCAREPDEGFVSLDDSQFAASVP